MNRTTIVGMLAFIVLASSLSTSEYETRAAPPARMLDAPDYPSTLAASQDGGFWVGLQTDTVAALAGYDANGSEISTFMAWMLEPVLAVSSSGDLFVGGFSTWWPTTGSQIMRFSSDGRHQRSWIETQTVFVDLDVSPTDEILALQFDFENRDDIPSPYVADRIVRYSTSGRRLGEWATNSPSTEIAVSPDGGVFVARTPRLRGSTIERLGPDGSRASQFEIEGSVKGMDFDAAGDLFVAAGLEGSSGVVHRYRPTIDGADQIASWSTCDEPRDIVVVEESRVIVLVRTPAQDDASISAICEHDGLGGTTRMIQIPSYSGEGVPPTATPVPGEITWLPLVTSRH